MTVSQRVRALRLFRPRRSWKEGCHCRPGGNGRVFTGSDSLVGGGEGQVTTVGVVGVIENFHHVPEGEAPRNLSCSQQAPPFVLVYPTQGIG